MLSTKNRRRIAVGLAAALVSMVALAPAAEGVKKKGKKIVVVGKVDLFVPPFAADQNQVLATGAVKGKRGCQKNRLVRFAYYTADGITPAPNTPQPSVVSSANGSFIVALPKPFADTPPQTFVIRSFVQASKVNYKGKKVNCQAIFGAGVPVVVTD